MSEGSKYFSYAVIAAQGVTLPAATEMVLTDRQLAARAHLVDVVATAKDASEIRAKAPLSFKRGEVITVAGDMPKAFLEQIAAPGATMSVAAERAAAKTDKAPEKGKGRGRGKGAAETLV